MEGRSPYAPPRSVVVHPDVADGWDGKHFLLSPPGSLPPLCVECGIDRSLETRVAKLRYVNPLTFLWFFLSPVALLIAYFVVIKRARVSYSHCAACLSTSRRWGCAAWLAGAVFGLALAARVLVDRPDADVPLAITMVVSFIGWAVAAAMKGPRLAIRKVRAGVFHIGGMKKAFVRRMSP